MNKYDRDFNIAKEDYNARKLQFDSDMQEAVTNAQYQDSHAERVLQKFSQDVNSYQAAIGAYQAEVGKIQSEVQVMISSIENAISKKRTEYEWIQNQLGLVSNKYNELFHGYANPVNTMNVESKDGKG